MSNSHTEILALIAAADDFRLTLMFETFLSLAAGSNQEPDDLIAGFPEDELGVSGDEVVTWIEDDQIAESAVGPSFAIEFSRSILSIAVDRPALQSFAIRAVTSPDDTKLKAGITVKIGAMATALMLVASTGFEGEIGGIKIKKEPLTAETIIALSELVSTLRGELPPLVEKKTK